MGLDVNAVQFLIAAHKRGVGLGEVVMLGRQDLNVFPAKMRRLLQEAELPSNLFEPGAPDTRFAEPVFKALGAREIYSIDFSAYEGASFVHDLNNPIGPELRERFDTVYDGGTLEHVFHFPTALKNMMEMLRPGGHLFIHTVANSYCGHGFYQFSPELFFRALSSENGYELERMVAHRMGPYGNWHEVNDPEKIGARVELISYSPIQLLVQARRAKIVPVFERTPQQSDFVPRWDNKASGSQPPIAASAAAPPRKYGAPRPRLAKSLPRLARLLNAFTIGVGLLKTHSLWNRKSFRRVGKKD
ncbi:MAG: hypothetical protein QOF48_1697 [Verrucomicrobiota bacterium]|jgi:SAM-dependent methyltransferase